jgi:hypothetical protein
MRRPHPRQASAPCWGDHSRAEIGAEPARLRSEQDLLDVGATRAQASSEAASAHTCVSASSGSGSTNAQRSPSMIFTPSISETSRVPARSITSRITVPLRSQGVTTVSCTT